MPPNDLPRVRGQRPIRDRRRGQDRDGRLPVAAAPRHRAAAADLDQASRRVGAGPRRIQPGNSSPSRCWATSPNSCGRSSSPNRSRTSSTGSRPRDVCCVSTSRSIRRCTAAPSCRRPNSNELRRIDDVVRMGHVQAIEPGRVMLDGGPATIDGSGAVHRLHGSRFRSPRGNDGVQRRPHHPADRAHLPAGVQRGRHRARRGRLRRRRHQELASAGPSEPRESDRLAANDAGVQREPAPVVRPNRR